MKRLYWVGVIVVICSLSLGACTAPSSNNITWDAPSLNSAGIHPHIYKSADGTARVSMIPPVTLTTQGNTFIDGLLLGKYYKFSAWLPDNSGFIVFDAQHGCEKCPWDRLIIFQINYEAQSLEHYIFHPLAEPNRAFWSDIVWAGDGSEFGVIVNMRQILVLNTKAIVLHVTKPTLSDDQFIEGFSWSRVGWDYKVETLDGSPSLITENRVWQPSNELDTLNLSQIQLTSQP